MITSLAPTSPHTRNHFDSAGCWSDRRPRQPILETLKTIAQIAKLEEEKQSVPTSTGASNGESYDRATIKEVEGQKFRCRLRGIRVVAGGSNRRDPTGYRVQWWSTWRWNRGKPWRNLSWASRDQ